MLWATHQCQILEGCAKALSVIYQAARDYHNKNGHYRKDTIKFFGSQWYKQLLVGLNLPADWLPLGVELSETAVCNS